MDCVTKDMNKAGKRVIGIAGDEFEIIVLLIPDSMLVFEYWEWVEEFLAAFESKVNIVDGK